MNKETQYPYGALMLTFNLKNWSNMIMDLVDENDLYYDEKDYIVSGLENEPHVTILYGFHEGVNPDHVKSLCTSLKNMEVILTSIGKFSNVKYDVLKFNVAKTKPIHNLHKTMRDNFPHTSQYTEYSPHMTIGYLKKGDANKYIQTLKRPYIFTPSSYKFSQATGRAVTFKK